MYVNGGERDVCVITDLLLLFLKTRIKKISLAFMKFLMKNLIYSIEGSGCLVSLKIFDVYMVKYLVR